MLRSECIILREWREADQVREEDADQPALRGRRAPARRGGGPGPRSSRSLPAYPRVRRQGRSRGVVDQRHRQPRRASSTGSPPLRAFNAGGPRAFKYGVTRNFVPRPSARSAFVPPFG